jgi:hypothetical protein
VKNETAMSIGIRVLIGLSVKMFGNEMARISKMPTIENTPVAIS